MYPHRIRLRGPWEAEPPGGPPVRLALPCRWGDAGLPFQGRVCFRRRFGRPTADADERVWLTGDAVPGGAAVRLNDAALGDAAAAFAFDVTALLRPRNELLIDVPAVELGGLSGEVALEVRRAAYLRGVRADRDEGGGLTVRGEAVGESPRPLDLYIILGRGTSAYTTITPTPQGQAFSLRADGEGDAVQVDLVDGAEVWYTVRTTPRRPA
jgi:hypothetical protein